MLEISAIGVERKWKKYGANTSAQSVGPLAKSACKLVCVVSPDQRYYFYVEKFHA